MITHGQMMNFGCNGSDWPKISLIFRRCVRSQNLGLLLFFHFDNFESILHHKGDDHGFKVLDYWVEPLEAQDLLSSFGETV
jgi:hypothetical protein